MSHTGRRPFRHYRHRQRYATRIALSTFLAPLTPGSARRGAGPPRRHRRPCAEQSGSPRRRHERVRLGWLLHRGAGAGRAGRDAHRAGADEAQAVGQDRRVSGPSDLLLRTSVSPVRTSVLLLGWLGSGGMTLTRRTGDVIGFSQLHDSVARLVSHHVQRIRGTTACVSWRCSSSHLACAVRRVGAPRQN